MLCGCLESPFDSSAPADRRRQKDASEEHLVTSFPGNRRLIKTGGNALVEFDPSEHQSSHSNVNETVGRKVQVSVVVPPGVSEGQTIQVAVPDGRMIAATIPPRMTNGSTFIVEFPAETATLTDPSAVQSPNGYQDVNVLPPPISGAPQSTPLSMPSSNPLPVLPAPIPVPASMPSPQPAINDGISNLSAAGSSHQTFILVKVPPNTKPGTTIHVQVPGESTIIAAQVPPGVDEFHVAYNHPDTGANNANPDGPQDGIRTGQISSSNGVGSEDRGEMEYIIPFVAGTALMGAAGLSILNHSRR